MDKMKALLDEEYTWPTQYTFKFIVTGDKVNEFQDFMKMEAISTNASRGGKYIGLTFQEFMGSSDEVVMTYQKAREFKGVISL